MEWTLASPIINPVVNLWPIIKIYVDDKQCSRKEDICEAITIASNVRFESVDKLKNQSEKFTL